MRLDRTVARAAAALAVAGVAPALAAAAAGAAPATPVWSLSATANVSTPNGTLAGVACPAATACIAVGGYDSRSAQGRTAAQSWNGTAWSTLPVPDPAGSASATLRGVSCISAMSCTAVGDVITTAGQDRTLAESWNGSTWAIQATPNPTGATVTTLDGVSCTSASMCIAVGAAGTKAQSAAFAEAWNGTAWSIQGVPDPSQGSGFTYSPLSGVSCVSASACVAVGQYYSAVTSSDVMLAESCNGSAWSVIAAPNPPGATQSTFAAVSCTSATGCVAVGDDTGGGGAQLPLAESWNGTAWSVQTTPNPPGATGDALLGVACTSSGACVTVGDDTDSTGAEAALSETWNGATWAEQSPPRPGHAVEAALSGVGCGAASSCTAVGLQSQGYSDLPLAERWSGSAWSAQTAPSPTGVDVDELNGVSCPSTTDCIAVGGAGAKTGTFSLAEQWNGSRWAIQRTPKPAGASRADLYAVSCASTSACVAVGNDVGAAKTTVPLAESWNGTGWSVVSPPAPAGASTTTLLAVSCAAATSCIAVGYSIGGSGIAAVVDSWNGSAWTATPPPAPAGSTLTWLDGVSCVTATACTAVGFSEDSSGNGLTLAERWDGTAWTVQPTPSPAGGSSQLNAVSCTSVSACTAAGSDQGGGATLAESWNGSTWSVDATPDPAGSTQYTFTSVSCTSATSCVAVGSDNPAAQPSQVLTLAETWNGTAWSISATPNVRFAFASELSAVACTSATACVAVGDDEVTEGTIGTLGEVFA